uniref:Alpha/beta hydrolase fold-3 domain-containing protein n=1 Tax=Oryza brachyantha TaxID=4533 RepID=J3MIR2_ORYBR
MAPAAAAAEQAYVVEACRGAVQLMSDGTVRRSAEPAFHVDVPEDVEGAVEWRDVAYEAGRDLNARLYRPRRLGAANDARLECRPDAFLTAEMSDKYARLILPEGATKDYPVLNPAGPEAPGLEAVAMAPVLVVAAEHDILRDRNEHYARRMMDEWGKKVEFVEFAGEQHGFFEVDPWSERADELVRLIRKFVVEHMDSE